MVHACNPPDLLFLPALMLKRRGAKFVFDQHDLVPELYLSRFGRGKDPLYRGVCALERMTYRAADVVLATNESYKDVAVRRAGGAPRTCSWCAARRTPSGSTRSSRSRS